MTTTDIFANQRQIWKDYKDVYTLARRALPFIIGVVIGGFIFASDEGYLTNLYTEIMSIIATVGILDFFYQRRDTQNLKKRLVREAGSRSNETAKSAIDWLRAEGWLTGEEGLLYKAILRDGNLQQSDLSDANLQETNLEHTNLEKANLERANLQNADLSRAILQQVDLAFANLRQTRLAFANLNDANLLGANLHEAFLFRADLQSTTLDTANLQGAILFGANFQQADLPEANLQGADLEHANLQQAYLAGVNLQNAYLKETKLEGAIWARQIASGEMLIATLPDGTKWTPDTDMTRFTDPNHPNFFQPPKREE